ncbi:MAG: DNA polymerase III subunit beta, partial [Verrucomicrobiota bacterium]
MKLTIDRKLLVSALATVKSVAASKPSLPILANVEIKTFERSVKFTCSNLDQTLQTKCEATVLETGSTTVRASLLCDLARSFVGDSVELRATKTKLDVRCGQSFFTLGTLDATEFPAIPRLKDPVEVTLAQHTLREALGSTCFAASSEESRYVLNGSYVHVNGQLTVASTDGRRLAEQQTHLDAKSAEALAIVPTASVNELMRLLRDDDDKNITLQIAKSMAQFSFDDTVLYT